MKFFRMVKIDLSKRGSFGSKFGIIAAAAGSAIGLGNIWRFPYIAGQNGGGAFLIVYLLFIISIGIPVMLSEFVIGRTALRNPYGAFKKLSPRGPWFLVGIVGVIAAFMILAFYGSVAGWTLEYLVQSVGRGFSGKSAAQLTIMFEDFRAGTFRPVLWQMIFMVLTASIVILGVQNGIEKYTKILMPLLLVIIIILCVRAVTLPGSRQGLEFLFKPDFSKLNANAVLEALGQAFFSLSIGMGALITYGSYIRKSENLANTAIAVSAFDTVIAILAGIAIFPAVFAFGIEPDSGTGLVFITLPNIFEQMAGGYFFALIFFVLLVVAALTSSISLLEVVVAFSVEEMKMSRQKATIIATGFVSILGFFCSLSWSGISGFSVGGMNFFNLLDFIAANILLPLGGLLIVIYLGWFHGRKKIRREVSNEGKLKAVFFGVYLFLIRFIVPVAIALVLLSKIGVF